MDATTVLSRNIASLGIYPAVDPLDSTSKALSEDIVGKEHYEIARKVQEVLQRYKEFDEVKGKKFYWDTLARDGLKNPIPVEIQDPDGGGANI